MDKTTLLLTIKSINKVGNVTAKKIMDSINSEITLEELYTKLINIKNIKLEKYVTLEKYYIDAVELLKKIKSSNMHIITYLDKEYPKSFLLINDPPVYLFYSGDIKIASQKCVAVVGTRKPSQKGQTIAYDLSVKLCKKYIIVSGLAEGIDTEAHRGTLDHNGKTIAILGHGLDMIFPSQNTELAKHIVDKGGLLLSEYLPGQTYSKYTFIARDRLQSALSEQVFVVETEEEGGTMHTAKKALEYGKQLFVFKSADTNYNLPSGNKILINDGVKAFDEEYLRKTHLD
jgi:DNA processing protein